MILPGFKNKTKEYLRYAAAFIAAAFVHIAAFLLLPLFFSGKVPVQADSVFRQEVRLSLKTSVLAQGAGEAESEVPTQAEASSFIQEKPPASQASEVKKFVQADLGRETPTQAKPESPSLALQTEAERTLGETGLAVSEAELTGLPETFSGSGEKAETEQRVESNTKLLSGNSSAAAAQGAESSRPRLLSQAKPAYPESARRRGLQGLVELKVLVSPEGSVVEAHIYKSSGWKVLDSAALEEAYSLVFAPAYDLGQAVYATCLVPLRFVLD